MQPRFPPPFAPLGQLPAGYPAQPMGGFPRPLLPGMPGAQVGMMPMPFNPMMMQPGMMPRMPMPGMMPGMVPGMLPAGMMPGMVPPHFGMQVPGAVLPNANPTLSSQVIVGAPVMKGPTGSLPQNPNLAISSINIFNGNTTATNINNTSNILHRHIFSNAHAGLPLTLFIGKIPLEFEDGRLARMVEACGKVNKFVRPTDPITQLPSSIAFVTYTQAICGLRCQNLINGLQVGTSDDGEPQFLVVKTGIKELNVIMSVQQVEKDAEKLLPPGSSLEEIYGPIRENIQRILNPSAATPAIPVVGLVNTVKSDSVAVSAPPVTDVSIDASTAPDGAESAVVCAANDAAAQALVSSISTGVVSTVTPSVSNYYAFGDDGELEGDSEQLMLSEIGKFRQRQTQRDVELEEQRRLKVKQRIKELYEAKKNEKIAPPPRPPLPPPPPSAPTQTATAAAATAVSNAADAAIRNYHMKDETSSKKRPTPEDPAEVEAKRRRRLEVLQMLAGDTTGLDLTTVTATEDKSVSAVNAPLKLKPAVAKKGAVGTSSGKPGTFASAIEADEDDKPKREIVLLEYTNEELRELNSHYLVGRDDDDDEEVAENGAVYKGKKKSLADVLSNMGGAGVESNSVIQARVLASAQALSASLAQKISNNIAAVDSSAASKAGGGTADQKAQLRQLLDRIPTQRDDLFAYKINWRAIETHDVIESTMRAWIVKKIVEYLGEEEESLTTFIVSKLNDTCQPAELVEELSMVLDEDAEQFVLKLWRMLIYYSIKIGDAN